MASLGMQFNPNEVEPAEDMSALPDGEYVAMIVDSEITPTKNNSGQYLKLTFQIIEGNFENRFVWHNLNLWNQNDTAVRIAQQQLSAICAGVGYSGIVDDSEVLHNKPLVIKVKYVPPKGEYKEKNEIKAFKKLEGQAPAAASQPQQAGPVGQQVANQQPVAQAQQPGQPVQNAGAGNAPVWAR